MPVAVHPTPLVGRERELAALMDQAAAARIGEPALVLVHGEAGVGKSRLVAEAATSLERALFRVAAGGCVYIPDLEQAQHPFGPFLEALRRLRGTERSTLSETQAAAIDTWLRPTPSRRTDEGTDPVYERYADFLTLMDHLTSTDPLLLILEDLQWADRSSLGLLVFLARNLTRERLLVIGTVRTETTLDLDAARPDRTASSAATLEYLGGQAAVSRLDVGPLPPDHLAALIRARAPGPRSPAAIETIVERAEGNTLVACELAEHDIDRVGSALPRSLSTAIADRLRRSSVHARAALDAASVVGPYVDHGLLMELVGTLLTGADEATCIAAANQAAETGLLLPAGDGYRFRHGLDREAIYATLMPGRRRALHAAAARALVGQAAADVAPADVAAEIAEHWRLSGDRTAAGESALAAARAAVTLNAYPEAMAHYERALDLSPTAAADAGVLVEAAEAARWAGELTHGLELLQRAVATASTPEGRGHVWERLGWFRREAGDGQGAMAAYEQALTEIGEDRTTATAARVLATYAAGLMLAGHYSPSQQWAEEALAVAEVSGNEAAKANALITLGVVASVRDDVEGGLALLHRGHDVAAACGAEEQRWRSLANMTYVLQGLGRPQETVRLAQEAVAAARGGRFPPAAMIVVGNGAYALTQLGRWQEAEDLLELGLARRSNPFEDSGLLVYAAQLDLFRGRLQNARARLEQAAAPLASMLDPVLFGELHRGQALLALLEGDLTVARQAVDRAIATLADTEEHEQMLLVLTIALRIEADASAVAGLRAPSRVAELADRVERAAEKANTDLADARIELLQCRAELARIADEDVDADQRRTARRTESNRRNEQAWQQFVDDVARTGRPHEEAYGRLQLAAAQLHGRRRDAAATSLAAGWTTATRLGAEPLVAAARALAARGRLPLPSEPGPEPEPPHSPSARAAEHGLTRREIEVLHLVVEGQTNRQIARQLGMSEKTASVHVSRLITKLGVRNRGEAAAVAHRLRLLDE